MDLEVARGVAPDDEEAPVRQRLRPLRALQDGPLLTSERRNAEYAPRHVAHTVEEELVAVPGPADLVDRARARAPRQDGPVARRGFHDRHLRRPGHEREERERLSVGRAARSHHARHGSDEQVRLPDRRRRVALLASEPDAGQRAASEEREPEKKDEPEFSNAADLPARGGGSRSRGDRGRRRLSHHGRRARQCRRQHRGTALAGRRRIQQGDTAIGRLLEVGELVPDLLQVARELRRRAVAIGRVLGEASLDRPAQGRRNTGIDLRERRRLFVWTGVARWKTQRRVSIS